MPTPQSSATHFETSSSSGKPVLGFIGMGLMGVPMTTRLLQAGFEVNVWIRNPDKLQQPARLGASPCTDLQALVRGSDIIMLCVSDTDAVKHIVEGPRGLKAFVKPGTIIVDFSSISPDATRDLADQLLNQCGAQWVDAPVSGGVSGAETGSLAIMAGGPEATIDAIRPILSHLSQRVTRMGQVGSGQTTKICNQMLVSCNLMVMAEVMAMAEKAGVDTHKIPQALKGGFADSLPLQLTGSRMADKDFEPVKWHVKTLLKDLDLSANLARQSNANTPMSQLARELMQQHANGGNQDKDPATLVELYSSGCHAP
ncbi:NAD(P)-dependent oxidoreductase [Aestuariicella hydrocarbonica]|uniref:NAD(P)-dependent oxidoreductase n=1 Tax=Pseudomaricurvus hydrocarbonicus TaxID=1470433 RepID=A0A9E5JRL8_9GAMM|nr:NAD(P)-dependent oxidoreductase [Aestuariicella hydrocarbonica]NHO65502.1 NAD(P)-dependent oxidoreductase [Aestuariicella hydrocarbonica]